ncbi:glucose-6-phosphate isomerase, partial [Candidatus Sumerlaeota bacterium]|nr:glucose-6-phosphate isomerase [Candidatus Sumerlaeota bacterium]
VSAHTLGMLIALFERAVGFYASLVNINAYHQPGVEAGKKAATAVLALQKLVLAELANNPDRPRTAGEIASAIGKSDDPETVLKILQRLASSPSRGVERDPGDQPWTDRYMFHVKHNG